MRCIAYLIHMVFAPQHRHTAHQMPNLELTFFTTIRNAWQTNSTKHSLSLEANSHSDKTKIPCLLFSLKVRYHNLNSQPLSHYLEYNDSSLYSQVRCMIHKYKEKATLQLQFVISPSLVGGTNVVMDHRTPYSPGPSSPLQGSHCDRTCPNATPWATVSLFPAHVVWFGTENSTHLHK